MPNKTIQDSLLRTTQAHRLVFWYDADCGWAEDFAQFSAPGVEKLEVNHTEFGAKVHITRTARADQKFLIYLPHARPLQDSDNWLLDLLLQGHEFKADKASLALIAVGLPHEYKELAETHIDFFRSGKRIQSLASSLAVGDLAGEIRLKMMAILANTAIEIDAMLLQFLRKGVGEGAADPVPEAFSAARLDAPFWKEVGRLFGYVSPTPSLLDFAVFLFSAANPLDDRTVLRPHATVFLQRWKDSREGEETFAAWSKRMERALHIRTALDAQGAQCDFGECDTFEAFDKFIIQQLCKAFQQGSAAANLNEIVQRRRSSFWRKHHQDGYRALEHAVELRNIWAAIDLTCLSIDDGMRRYMAEWWRVDHTYRRCVWHLRSYGQDAVMAAVAAWVEKAYVTNFLLPLADNWSDQVKRLDAWQSSGISPQRQFFTHYVQPIVAKGQTVFVIISDALRYEAAAEFAAQLAMENRWTTAVEALLGALPSYTQLGMAALLPGMQREIDPATAQVRVDGRSATGLANRGAILSAFCNGRAAALSDEEFLRLNRNTTGNELVRDHDVIYIFHNKIDKVGDDRQTEGEAFAAVESAFEDLRAIVKKVTNLNGSNILLTADHGFLFQQDDLDDNDLLPLPTGASWTYQNRRFALSATVPQQAGVKSFTAAQLGLPGDFVATFPLSLGRFPRSGSGKRFVHGGFSLQEIVVPVVRIHKARSDDLETVEVDFQRVPSRVTTGQFTLALFQQRPAGGKVQGRILRVAVFFGNTMLSDAKTLHFDSTDPEPRNRESALTLTMAPIADKYNGQDVEIRLDEEPVAGNGRFQTYRRQIMRIHKPFASDFDE